MQAPCGHTHRKFHYTIINYSYKNTRGRPYITLRAIFLTLRGSCFLSLPTRLVAAIAMSANRESRAWYGPVHPRGPAPPAPRGPVPRLGPAPSPRTFYTQARCPLPFMPPLHFYVSATCSTYMYIPDLPTLSTYFPGQRA